MAFLTAIAWTIFVLSRQQQLTLATLSDGRRALLYGGLGLIALLIAGSDELFSSGGGTLAWILLLGASVAAIWRVWSEAKHVLTDRGPGDASSREYGSRQRGLRDRLTLKFLI